MNPIKQIGRYQLPLLSVVAIQDLPRWRRWLTGASYRVILENGRNLYFTQEERNLYDKELEFHNEVMRVYGICLGAGLRG
jgi:hypothetical protein